MKRADILVVGVDIDLLREQQDYLSTLEPCDHIEGIMNLIDHMLDEAEEN